MTTLAAYCQSMGWDLKDPAIRAKVQSAVGNISENTELQEYQMDALQNAIHNAMGTLKPGDEPMLDAFGGKRNSSGDLQFKSNQDALDYLNSTVPKKQDTGSFWDSPFVQQPLNVARGIFNLAKDGVVSAWRFLTE